jgi:cell division protein FtsB
MTTENNSSKFKILVGVLSVLLIGLAVYTVTLYNDSKSTVSSLEKQKDEIQTELEELIANYDEVIEENELKDRDLLAARERIEILLDSVKDSEANVALIQRYKIEVGRLKNERKALFRKADSLIAVNNRLVVERDSTSNALSQTIKVVDSVNMENEALSETVKRAAVVSATDLRGEAVIVRNSGKVVDTRRSSRADKVRACFQLAPNVVAEPGDRTFFVQIINPRNNILGEKGIHKYKNGILNYSKSVNVYYENEELDVCTMVDAKEEDLIEGRYIINVFDGGRQIATTTLELK